MGGHNLLFRKMTEAWIQPTVLKSTAPSPFLNTSKASSAFSSLPASMLPLLRGAGVMLSACFSWIPIVED